MRSQVFLCASIFPAATWAAMTGPDFAVDLVEMSVAGLTEIPKMGIQQITMATGLAYSLVVIAFLQVSYFFLTRTLATRLQLVTVSGQDTPTAIETPSAAPQGAKVLFASLEHNLLLLPESGRVKCVAGGLGTVVTEQTKCHPTDLLAVHAVALSHLREDPTANRFREPMANPPASTATIFKTRTFGSSRPRWWSRWMARRRPSSSTSPIHDEISKTHKPRR